MRKPPSSSIPKQFLLGAFLYVLMMFPGNVLAQTQDSTVRLAAGTHYLKSGFHRFWWGRHYRRVWAEPVRVPLFYVSQFKGGVTPLKEGGSFQTKNLRLVDAAGREYVLRSIDKDPSRALPEKLQTTFVAGLMRDQTSVIQPYGAFIVPTLASAAGVYHTNPKLVYIADDPALGEFQSDFGNLLALLEERPDGNWEHLQSFGNPEMIVSSRKAFEQLIRSPDHQVDTRRYLKSRLFDMWLSDWSRREDQWRWAVAEKEGSTQYAPIPRDRDHAFFKFNDGVLTKLATIFKPNYQSFDATITNRNVQGLIKSSFQMDSYLLLSLPKETFLEVARELQQDLSDAVIDQALQQWPENIRALSAQEFKQKLSSRRNDLPQAAQAFYQEINQDVLLAGTDAEDEFQLTFQADGKLLLEHWGISPQTKQKVLLHHRTFDHNETKQLSIFGLGEEDTFVLRGSGKNKMEINLYGGEGSDHVNIDSSFQLSGRKIQLYDEEDGNEYPAHKWLKREKYVPAAQEFNGQGWLLRHRLH